LLGSAKLEGGQPQAHKRSRPDRQQRYRLRRRASARPATFRGSIRRTAVVLADDRFDRDDGPEPACTERPGAAPRGRGGSRRRASRRRAPGPRFVAEARARLHYLGRRKQSSARWRSGAASVPVADCEGRFSEGERVLSG
jgi:hypothetical protein